MVVIIIDLSDYFSQILLHVFAVLDVRIPHIHMPESQMDCAAFAFAKHVQMSLNIIVSFKKLMQKVKCSTTALQTKQCLYASVSLAYA